MSGTWVNCGNMSILDSLAFHLGSRLCNSDVLSLFPMDTAHCCMAVQVLLLRKDMDGYLGTSLLLYFSRTDQQFGFFLRRKIMSYVAVETAEHKWTQNCVQRFHHAILLSSAFQVGSREFSRAQGSIRLFCKGVP